MLLFVLAVAILFIIAIVVMAAADQQAAEEKGNAMKSIPGFSVSASFLGGAGASGIAIDSNSRRVAIMNGSAKPAVLGYDEILAAEVSKDGSTLTKVNRGSQVAGAAVGAVLLGPIGLLLGGLTGSTRQVEKVKRLSLKLYTDNVANPVFEVIFFTSSTPLPADSDAVVGLLQQLDSWFGRIRAIVEP